jgi:hypothetical protein
MVTRLIALALASSAAAAQVEETASAPLCQPDHPPADPQFERDQLVGFVLATITVSESGVVSAVEVNPTSTPQLVERVRRWLLDCPRRPATRGNRPVSARETVFYRFRPASLLPPQPYRASISLPVPTAECTTREPPAPLTAQALHMSGAVTVAYDVELDGRVSAVTLYKNTGAPLLFDAVRVWLFSCPRKPARAPDGKPFAVRMVETFWFGWQRRR